MGQACCAMQATDDSDRAKAGGGSSGGRQSSCVAGFVKDVDGGTAIIPAIGSASWQYRSQRMSDEEVAGCVERLRAPHRVASLKLIARGIGDVGAASVATLLPASSSAGVLTHLDLSHNDIGYAGARALSEALVGGKQGMQLRSLSLLGNRLGEGALHAFGEMLKDNASLEALELCVGGDGSVPVSSAGIRAIAEGVATNATLGSLRITGEGALLKPKRKSSLRISATNSPTAQGTHIIDANALKEFMTALSGSRLQALHTLRIQHIVAHCDQRRPADGIKEALAHCAAILLSNKCISVLDFEGCALGDSAVEALAAACGADGHLRELHLPKNCIGDAGLAALGTALAKNTSLELLDIREQQNPALTHAGPAGLLQSLVSNTALRELRVMKVPSPVLDQRCAAALAALLQKNRTLADVRYGAIDDDGIRKEVEERLEANRTAAQLKMSEKVPAPAAPEPVSVLRWRDGFSGAADADSCEEDEAEEGSEQAAPAAERAAELNESTKEREKEVEQPCTVDTIDIAFD